MGLPHPCYLREYIGNSRQLASMSEDAQRRWVTCYPHRVWPIQFVYLHGCSACRLVMGTTKPHLNVRLCFTHFDLCVPRVSLRARFPLYCRDTKPVITARFLMLTITVSWFSRLICSHLKVYSLINENVPVDRAHLRYSNATNRFPNNSRNSQSLTISIWNRLIS